MPSMGEPEWTPSEGARAVSRFLARRAPAAAVAWVSFAAPGVWFSNLGGVAGELSVFTVLVALVALLAGVPVGAIFGRGLVETVCFVGWIPTASAAAASLFVVVGGTLAVHAVYPFTSRFTLALVCTIASVGALAAVLKFTWADQ